MLKFYLFFSLLIITLTFMVQNHAQQTKDSKKYQTDNFEFDYPSTWLISTDDSTVNVYREKGFGSITFSYESGIDFSLEMTKEFILEMNGVKDNLENVKMEKKETQVEFTYSHFDKDRKFFVFTKVIRKKKDFYLMIINCQAKHWETEKTEFFKIIDSFKIKKKPA